MELTNNVVSMALAAIDLSKWGCRGSIVEFVRRETLGSSSATATSFAKLGYELVAWNCGLQDRYTQKVLAALVDERVLLRADGKPHGYRINAEVRAWRKVPWRGDRLDVLTRIESFSRPRPGDSGPGITRHSAESRPFIPRHSAGSNGRNPATYRGNEADGITRHSAQSSRRDDARAPIPSLRASSLGSEPGSAQGNAPLVELVAAIERRTGKTVFGEPLGTLARIAASHPDPALLVEWIDAYPVEGNGPPIIVRDLAANLARATSTAPPRTTPPPAPRPDCSACKGSGWIEDRATGDARRCRHETVAATCENPEVSLEGVAS